MWLNVGRRKSQWITIDAYPLPGIKQLPKPILMFCQLDPNE